MSETKMENEIDIAINSLDESIEEHNRDAKVAQNRALYGILILASVFMMILMLSGVGSIAKVDTSKEDSKNTPNERVSYVTQIGEIVEKNKTLLFVFVGLSVMNFGVFMALHRHHLNEVSKARHFKLGFQRVQIAAENYSHDGYQTEVRQSLVEGAFSYNQVSSLGSKKVESPMPGHPTSDISTLFLNKMLEAVEVKPVAKKP